MKLIRVNLHSAVDVITNSSTTIFTYSGGSDKKAIELVDELLKVVGSDLTADEMFYMGVFADSDVMDRIVDDFYGEDDEDLTEDQKALRDGDWKNTKKMYDECIKKAIMGEEVPSWFTDAQEYEDYDGYGQTTTLFIAPKKEKYSEVADKITSFLYSTSHEANYN